MKKVLVSFVLGVVAFTPLVSRAQADFGSAEDYLVSHANDPWSTMALTVLGASSIPTNYLKSVSGQTAIEYAAPILAITGLDEDPRTFGDTDYVAALKAFDTNNQIGDEDTVNDDIFGLLALVSAGLDDSDPVVADAQTFILDHQDSNGGWGFSTSGGTDSNMTASAIVALIASGVDDSDSVILNGLNYLLTTQNDDGGFTYDPESPWGTASDSSSTAWVIWALNAASIDPASWIKSDHTPTEYLESNQTPGGYFSYQTGSPEDSFSAITTAYAVIALEGETLPLNIFTAPDSFALEYTAGANGNISGVALQTVNPEADGSTVTAVAEAGFHFVKWSDGLLTASRTDIHVTTDITVTASFAKNSSGGSSGGRIAPPVTDPEPTGQVLGSITFPTGTLVKTADNPTVYIVENNKFRPFSSEKIFLAYNLKFSDVQITGMDMITGDNLGAIMDYPDGTPHE